MAWPQGQVGLCWPIYIRVSHAILSVRFVRHFADVQKEIERGVAAYVHAVKDGSFPNPEREGYAIDPTQWESFLHTQRSSRIVEENHSAETTPPVEFRASTLPRANEADEKTAKKGELHTL